MTNSILLQVADEKSDDPSLSLFVPVKETSSNLSDVDVTNEVIFIF